jgi:hypothetical protein
MAASRKSNLPDFDAGSELPDALPPAPASPAPTFPVPPTVDVADQQVVACYANFCRVTGTPEEVVLDFGLNVQPMGVGTGPVGVQQRIVTNFYTAKRILFALQVTLQRHEAAFGALETDIQKRVVGAAGRTPGRV